MDEPEVQGGDIFEFRARKRWKAIGAPDFALTRQFLVSLPRDGEWLDVLQDLLALAATREAWQGSQTISDLDAATTFASIGETMYEVQLIGMLAFFASRNVPSGWLRMGQQISVADYPELAQVVPTEWLDNPFNPTHIQLPALAGTSLIPPGHYSETGYSHEYVEGESAGEARHTLTVSEMASHGHVQDAHNHAQAAHNHAQSPHAHLYTTMSATVGAAPVQAGVGIQALPLSTAPATAVNLPATATNTETTATNQQTGGGQAHNNMPPYATFGLYIFAGR